MASLLLLWTIICLFIYRNKETEIQTQNEELISSLSIGLIMSAAAIGSASLIFAWLGLEQNLILLGLALSSIIIAATKTSRSKLLLLSTKVANLLRECLRAAKRDSVSRVSFWITIFILIASIGPINHPDASDYHAGYPWHIFRAGKAFIDGGLHQGLLGLADFAYIQDFAANTPWLIRTYQVLPIIVIYLYITAQRHSKGFLPLAIALTSPAWIQVATIGKPLFFGEACTAISYIIWTRNTSINNLSRLVSCLILCLTFKISSVIFCLPIALDLAIQSRARTSQVLHHLWKSPLIAISGMLFLTITLEKLRVTGNPIYPLFSEFFTPENKLQIAFEAMLKDYKRDIGSALNLVFPLSIGEIGMTLGPSLFLLVVQAISFSRNSSSWSRRIGMVVFFQILLMLLFGQIRADYFLGALVLLITAIACSSDADSFKTWKVSKAFLVPQAAIFCMLFLFTLYTNISSAVAFDKTMNQFAYGYTLSRVASQKGELMNTTVSILAGRNTRLYLDRYVDSDRFRSCLNSNHENKINETTKNNSEITKACMRELGIGIIYTSKLHKDSLDTDNFTCSSLDYVSPSRNPLSKNRHRIYECSLIKD